MKKRSIISRQQRGAIPNNFIFDATNVWLNNQVREIL